ncbi:MAG: hypothetical protein R3202_01355, partial [Candidatus Competibacterales bacterium]|nr:hypothetical protein [Candidatus Competibacterales bacterium]
MLSRLFRPKWQHANVEIRRQALQALAADDPVRHQLARQDQDPGVRRAALARVEDLELLRVATLDDGDAGVREYARARLSRLLVEAAAGSPPLAERRRVLESILSPDLAEQFAAEAPEPELRLAALGRVEREEFCAVRAVRDPAATVRLAALERVGAPELLERIARQARNRDKTVSRLARERLSALLAERDRQARIEQICSELETLEWDGETGANAAHFARIERDWQPLAEAADSAQHQRYQQAHQRFQGWLRASAERRQARTELLQQLDWLSAVSPATGEGAADPEVELMRIRAAWDALGPAEDLDSRRLQRRFEEGLTEVHRQQQRLDRDRQRVSRLQTVLAQGTQLLERAGQVMDDEVDALERQWRTLPRPEDETTLQELQAQYERVAARLRQRLDRQAEARERELAELEACLADLEQALEAGELQQAIDTQARGRHLLQHNISLTPRQMHDFEQRLQACTPRITELRGWRRWGTNRSRENLLETVQVLAESELEPDERAAQVKAARARWQEMDRTAGPAPRALRRRFDQLSEQAFAPVREQRR